MKTKKLRLSRETLQKLEDETLDGAAGGATGACASKQFSYCATCVCSKLECTGNCA